MSDKKIYFPLSDIENVLPILNKIAIFGALSDKQLYSVFKLLQRVSYKKGEFIYKQGNEPKYIYIIQSGEVRIVADVEGVSLEMMSFLPGDCFGETAVIGIQSHSMSAVAIENSDLIVLSRKSLLSIFETDKELFGLLILNIAREACRLLHKTDQMFLKNIISQLE